MSITKTAFLISIDNPENDGIMADTFEETLIFVGRLIERLNQDNNFSGKYIYVTEYLNENGNGNFILKDNLFVGKYLIEK